MGYCVVWVHGAGPTQPGYSKSWVAAYNPYLHFTTPPDAYVETYWAGVFAALPGEVAETAVRDFLKTVFLAKATAQVQKQGLAGAWDKFIKWVTQSEATLPDWVINQDVYLDQFVKYLVNQAIRDEVKEEIKKQLRPLAGNDDICSIIAHSWGTVVAYESLLDLARELPAFQCANLFTLGSPLWLVHYLLEDKTGRKPGNVANWVNIDAQGDVVGAGLKPGFQVDADYAVANFGKGDPHGSYFVPGNVAVERDIIAATILKKPSKGPH